MENRIELFKNTEDKDEYIFIPARKIEDARIYYKIGELDSTPGSTPYFLILSVGKYTSYEMVLYITDGTFMWDAYNKVEGGKEVFVHKETLELLGSKKRAFIEYIKSV